MTLNGDQFGDLAFSESKPGIVHIGGRPMPAITSGHTYKGGRYALLPMENGGFSSVTTRKGEGRGLGDVEGQTYWDVDHSHVSLGDSGIFETPVERVQNISKPDDALKYMRQMSERERNAPSEEQRAEHQRVSEHLRSNPDVWWARGGSAH